MPTADHIQRRRAAYASLRAGFTHAAFDDPCHHLPTPGGLKPVRRLVDVVADCLGPGDELDLLGPMLRIVAAAADGRDPRTRLPANALLARLAHLYAEEHADDLADMLPTEASHHAAG